MEPLEPQLLAFLERRHGPDAAAGVARETLSPVDSATGASLERLAVPGESGRYIVKRLAPLGDWIARATNDTRVRERQIATSGILRALPPGVGAAVVESLALDSDRHALVMRDVSDALAPGGDTPFNEEQARESLLGLARLHAAYATFPVRLTAGLGLATIASWLTLLAPATAAREAGTTPRDPVTPHILPGWEAFATLAPRAWRIVEPLLGNPAPLVAALRECPTTILHGDAKAGNLAFEEGRVILLDWSQSMRGPGALDLGWWLAVNAAKRPAGHSRDDAIEVYRAERERLGRLPSRGEAWERELALALLGGGLRLGWAKALGALSDDAVTRDRERDELDWWSAIVVGGAHWLG